MAKRDAALHSDHRQQSDQCTWDKTIKVLEYRPDVIPKTTWTQDSTGLHIRAMHAQRLYNNREWPNPVVLKITNVEAAFEPPVVKTGAAIWDEASASVTFHGTLEKMGNESSYRSASNISTFAGLTSMSAANPGMTLISNLCTLPARSN